MGKRRPHDHHYHGKFQPLLQPSKPFLSTRNKKESSEKNHRFWRNLFRVGTLVPLSLPPPSSARLCALLSIESGMSRKREEREELKQKCNSSWKKDWSRSGKRIVLFLDGKLASRNSKNDDGRSIQSSSFTREGWQHLNPALLSPFCIISSFPFLATCSRKL